MPQFDSLQFNFLPDDNFKAHALQQKTQIS